MLKCLEQMFAPIKALKYGIPALENVDLVGNCYDTVGKNYVWVGKNYDTVGKNYGCGGK